MSLERFVEAQRNTYARALDEIRAGRKTSHWMWYIFPQIIGLGSSPVAQRFAIRDIDEARAYLDHDLLGSRLYTCCDALLALKHGSAFDIFGSIDELKLRSCLTLFSTITENDEAFALVLDQYFNGIPDQKTLEILKRQRAATGQAVPDP